MKRIFLLISAIAVGIVSMIASTLSDIKSEISKIEGVTCIDASEETHVQEFSVNNCEVILLNAEIMDKVMPILSKIPEDLIFADVNDEDGTKATIWAEPEDGTTNGGLLIFVDTEGKQLVIYAQGDLNAMEAGIHID